MFREERDEFRFDWTHLGDIDLGRPNLGPQTSVAIYRLMQFTIRDALIKHADLMTASRVLYDAGYNSGRAIYENLIDEPRDIHEFVTQVQQALMKLKLGILRVEESDIENLTFTLTVSEDLDCSGLPMIEEAICTYSEGMIAGLLESFAGLAFDVKEVDCWCTGDRVCRLRAISTEKPEVASTLTVGHRHERPGN